MIHLYVDIYICLFIFKSLYIYKYVACCLLSMAYPFVGLGFVMTMLLGWAFLNEDIGLLRIVGTLLIVAGVVLVSRS